MARKLILNIAMSLDGFIAKKDDNIDFLSIVDKAGEDYGHLDFLQNIDTIIWGRRTLDKVKSFGNGIPYADKNVYVVSKTRTGKEAHATYVEDVVALVQSLKQVEGKDIYCDGGAEVVFLLLESRLIDRIIVSIIPHLLGDGIRLFKAPNVEQQLEFIRSISYPSGLVQLCYEVKCDPAA